MFNQMKQMYEAKKKIDQLQKQLEAIKSSSQNASGTLAIAVNGTQRVESMSIDASWMNPERKEALEQSLVQLINSAFGDLQKKTAAQTATLMKDLKGLNLPGF
jgi:DNA-binding YbaB/EbfC family protein